MLPSEELLQSIDIIAQNAAKNSVKIYTAIVTAVGDNNTCSVRVNGKTHSNIAYYGDAPSVNKSYRVFCPNGSMNQAFIITGGGSSGESAYTLPIASADVLGGIKVGAGLTISTEGTLSATGGGTADAVEWKNVLDKPTTIAGYGITDAKIENGTITLGNQTITPLTSAPVTSVNSKTGAVMLTANDVGALPADTVIPTVNNATLTIRRNSVDIGSFTANSADDVNIDINVPTDKSDIGLGNVDNVKQYSATNPPPYPVTSVNGKTGAVTVHEVPAVTTTDNGKFLRVVNGAWTAVAIADASGVKF